MICCGTEWPNNVCEICGERLNLSPRDELIQHCIKVCRTYKAMIAKMDRGQYVGTSRDSCEIQIRRWNRRLEWLKIAKDG